MATTFASLGLGDLPLHEKRVVINDLMQEADAEFIPGGFATREEFHAELLRRADYADAHPESLRSFDEVEAEILAELGEFEQGK